MTQRILIIRLVGVTAGAGVGGVAAILAVGSGHHSLIIVTQSRHIVRLVVVAAGAGVGGITGLGTGGGGHSGLIIVTDGSDRLGVGVATGRAGIGAHTGIGTGGLLGHFGLIVVLGQRQLGIGASDHATAIVTHGVGLVTICGTGRILSRHLGGVAVTAGHSDVTGGGLVAVHSGGGDGGGAFLDGGHHTIGIHRGHRGITALPHHGFVGLTVGHGIGIQGNGVAGGHLQIAVGQREVDDRIQHIRLTSNHIKRNGHQIVVKHIRRTIDNQSNSGGAIFGVIQNLKGQSGQQFLGGVLLQRVAPVDYKGVVRDGTPRVTGSRGGRAIIGKVAGREIAGGIVDQLQHIGIVAHRNLGRNNAGVVLGEDLNHDGFAGLTLHHRGGEVGAFRLDCIGSHHRYRHQQQ